MFTASALSLNEHHVFVEYAAILANEDDVDGAMLRERVPMFRVRPQPPRSTRERSPRRFQR